MEIKEILQDKDYFIVMFFQDKREYVLLYDKKQNALFLAQDVKKEEINVLWENHLKDKNFCIPCEFMLRCEKKVVLTTDYPPLEMELSLKEISPLLMEMDKKIKLPYSIKMPLQKVFLGEIDNV